MYKTHLSQMRAWSDETYTDMEMIEDKIIYVCRDHVRISLDDYKKLKPRLMRTPKQGDENHGNTETRQQEKESTSDGWDRQCPGVD